MIDDIQQLFAQRNVRQVKVGGVDLDGVLRGKYISLEKFFSAVEHGFGFCDVIFGWDSSDVLYDNVTYTGWHTGYPDTLAKIDLDTCRVVPWEPETALCLVDFYWPDGVPLGLSPRQVLKRVIADAHEKGFAPFMSSEYEYFLFRETPQSIREKQYRNMTPLSPGMFGYSIVRASAAADLVHGIIDGMRDYGIELEGVHTETGPGVYETAIKFDAALRAADHSTLFKTGVKEITARHGVVATFMAKWSPDLPGCSGHLHQSLWSLDGKRNLFHDDDGRPGLSALMRHYIAGQLALMPELTALVAPTINSYKRLRPRTWAPTTASWGVENRTTAIRAIPGGAKSTRVEYRLAGADVNPYIGMAATLAAGLYGIEHRLEPPEPWAQNAYTAPDGMFPSLPGSLPEATAKLKESTVARQLLGDEFIDHFVATREWEIRQFQAAVTDWELQRYFEVI